MNNSSSYFSNQAEPLILECRNVEKVFSRSRKSTFKALTNVCLEIKHGDFVAILGQSGGGKSTILKLLGGFDYPTSGQVLFHGAPLKGITPKIGMIFQENTLYPWLNVEQNIGFGFKVRGKSRQQYTQIVENVMNYVGLSQSGHLYPHQLSGGMKQRVSIARSLATQPDVLLLDEPFSALDIQMKRRLQKFLIAIWKETQAAMVLVTHDVEEAILLGQKLIVVGGQPGQIVEEVDVTPEIYSDRYHQSFIALQQHLELVIGESSDIAEMTDALAPSFANQQPEAV